MKRLLLLGGTAEALNIAKTLPQQHIYSLAGVGGPAPELNCQVRIGGLEASNGLENFLHDQSITLILDATHPYAANISRYAADAARKVFIPYWTLARPLWTPLPDCRWQSVNNDWQEILQAISEYKRPFFTIGMKPLEHLPSIKQHQHWYIRCLNDVNACLNGNTDSTKVTIFPARGPFSLENERALFQQFNFDVLISKNSGSIATEPKLILANERKIPVIMLNRPELPKADRTFLSADAAIAELNRAKYL